MSHATWSRRSFVTGMAGAAVGSAFAPSLLAAVPVPARPEDERFMRIALEEARGADFPFGAAIVRQGTLLTRGGNRGASTDDPTAHGEMVTLRRALAEHGSEALRGATLYTTGEPCAMCMGAILWCGFGRLVYAASLDQLAARIDQIMLSSRQVAAAAPFAPIEITGGVLADDAVALFDR